MENSRKYFTHQSNQKEQWIYVVLALLLGPFGIHNFYAERWGRGLIQLLLTLATGFTGTLISSLWAIFNIFSIETDGNGRPFNLSIPAKYICGILGILKYLGEIIFWGFLLIGFLTGNLTAQNLRRIGHSHSVQESYEKIVTPNETIIESSQSNN